MGTGSSELPCRSERVGNRLDKQWEPVGRLAGAHEVTLNDSVMADSESAIGQNGLDLSGKAYTSSWDHFRIADIRSTPLSIRGTT